VIVVGSYICNVYVTGKILFPSRRRRRSLLSLSLRILHALKKKNLPTPDLADDGEGSSLGFMSRRVSFYYYFFTFERRRRVIRRGIRQTPADIAACHDTPIVSANVYASNPSSSARANSRNSDFVVCKSNFRNKTKKKQPFVWTRSTKVVTMVLSRASRLSFVNFNASVVRHSVCANRRIHRLLGGG